VSPLLVLLAQHWHVNSGNPSRRERAEPARTPRSTTNVSLLLSLVLLRLSAPVSAMLGTGGPIHTSPFQFHAHLAEGARTRALLTVRAFSVNAAAPVKPAAPKVGSRCRHIPFERKGGTYTLHDRLPAWCKSIHISRSINLTACVCLLPSAVWPERRANPQARPADCPPVHSRGNGASQAINSQGVYSSRGCGLRVATHVQQPAPMS
jgi:hypothetical protein